VGEGAMRTRMECGAGVMAEGSGVMGFNKPC